MISVLLGRSESATCHLRRPKRCGPVISPGGHALSVLHPQTVVPPNLLFINASKQRALVCVPAKSGSTSFYFWLYHALTGVHWPFRGAPWVQETSSSRWANVPAKAVRFAHLPHRARTRVLSDASILRYALVRHPLDRGYSAYYSKIACNSGDRSDHVGAIRQLSRQAPVTAAAANLLKPVLKVAESGLDASSSALCLSATQWLQMLLEARAGGHRMDVNPHFMPQVDACGLHQIGYHHLIPLEDHAYGLRRLAADLGVKANRLTRNHVVHNSLKRPFSDNDTSLLQHAFREDMNLLQFPLVWPPNGSAVSSAPAHNSMRISKTRSQHASRAKA